MGALGRERIFSFNLESGNAYFGAPLGHSKFHVACAVCNIRPMLSVLLNLFCKNTFFLVNMQ